MPFQWCIIRPGALGGFRIRAILSRNTIISVSHPPRQLLTWEYHRRNPTILLYFTRRQRQVLECFWKSDQKNTLITGFRTCNEHGTSRGSKPVHIGDLCMGLISCLQHLHVLCCAMIGDYKIVFLIVYPTVECWNIRMWDYPTENSLLSDSEVYTILVTRMHSVRFNSLKILVVLLADICYVT